MPKPKKKKDRRKEIISQWQDTRKVADAIIKAGVKEPEKLKQGVLRELVSILSHGMKVLRVMQVMQEESDGQEMYLQRRRRELISMYEGITKIAKALSKAALENPLEVGANKLNQLNVISRRSLEMLSVLDAMEQQEQEERELEENGGISPEDEALLREFEEMTKEMTISPDGDGLPDFETSDFNPKIEEWK